MRTLVQLASFAFAFAISSEASSIAQEKPEPKAGQLPKGAIVRLGSSGLRTGSPITGMAVLPGGKQILTADGNGLIVWDLKAGDRIARASNPEITQPKSKLGFSAEARPFNPTALRITVNRSQGSLVVSPDGKSVLLQRKAGASLEQEYFRYALPFDGTQPASLFTGPISIRENPAVVVYASPATKLFSLSLSGRLEEKKTPRDLSWSRIVSVPPVAGDHLAVATGGGIIAFGGEDERVRLWDAIQNKYLGAFDTEAVRSIALSSDGKVLAASGISRDPNRSDMRGSLKVWTIADRKEMAHWDEAPEHLALSATGKLLAVSESGRKVDLYEVATGKIVSTFATPGNGIRLLEFLPDDSALIAAGQSGAIRVWDLTNNASRVESNSQTSKITSIQFTPDGDVVTAGMDGLIRVWNAAGKEIRQFQAEENGIEGMRLSSDGKTLFTAGTPIQGWKAANPHVRAWDFAKGTKLREYSPEKPVASFNALDLNRKTLAIGFYQGGVYLLDAETFKLIGNLGADVYTIGRNDWLVDALSFAAGGLLVSRANQMFRVWDVVKTKELRQIKGSGPNLVLQDPQTGLPKLAVSPDGKKFAAPYILDYRPTYKAALGLWDIDSGNLDGSFDLPKAGSLLSVAFHPDGNTVAVGDHKGRVWLVDIATKGEPKLLDGLQGPVLCLEFSKDGKKLASGGADTTVVIWNTESR